MPRTGEQTNSRFFPRRVNRRLSALIVSCGIASTILFISACAGVDDNGTDLNLLATMEARRNQPPPTMPTPDPNADPGDPAQLAAAGRQIYNTFGCQGCHSVDGSQAVGPTWQGLWMSEIQLEDGSTVVADEEYITTAILDPGAQIHAGYPNIMPSFQGQLDENQIRALIEFIKAIEEGTASVPSGR